ncbi:SRPBCC family protein [Actinosynnema sp. NPDC050436]|uniref:SRPBCC family protein n=1 Tax=Actinosynnema sp. NPDC050436 TaxID=3155659 RepID=UPI0033C8118E
MIRSTTTPRRRAGALVSLLAVVGTLGTAAPAQAAPGTGAPLTCRGQGVDPTAKARHRAEILITAPLHRVWDLQTDVEAWPTWQRPAAPMTVERLDHGPLRTRSRFRATVALPTSPPAAIVITSTVRQLQHGRCLRWTGPADGPGFHVDGVHVWTFVPVAGGVLVRTEETHTGPQADEDSDLGLDTWLADLKAAAEKPC